MVMAMSLSDIFLCVTTWGSLTDGKALYEEGTLLCIAQGFIRQVQAQLP